jgi:hypothetical protein
MKSRIIPLFLGLLIIILITSIYFISEQLQKKDINILVTYSLKEISKATITYRGNLNSEISLEKYGMIKELIYNWSKKANFWIRKKGDIVYEPVTIRMNYTDGTSVTCFINIYKEINLVSMAFDTSNVKIFFDCLISQYEYTLLKDITSSNI